MIFKNASSIPLNQQQGTVPQMGSTLLDWFQQMTFVTVVQTIVNYKVVDAGTEISFQGVWQPLTPQELEMKPEGQRDWSWFKVHAQPSLFLKVDEVVKYLGIQYRVRSRLDYAIYGYYEYHLSLDYTGSGPTV